jgi:peroxiredoxin
MLLRQAQSSDDFLTEYHGAVEPGASAPDFACIDWQGETIRLSELFAGRVWLAFFRYAACPMCNLRVQEMIDRCPAWAAPEFRILGVIHSPAEHVPQYMGRLRPPFPLLCDPGMGLYKLYGLREAKGWSVLHPGGLARHFQALLKGFKPGPVDSTFAMVPADFLIGEGGVVEHIHYGRHPGDHIPFGEVERWLGFQLPSPRYAKRKRAS